MSTTTLNKHAQRTKETRALLLHAAETIFVRDGYEGADLGEIAALAGRTKGAIYAHFKSKEDVFLELWKERTQSNRQRLRSLLAGATSKEQNLEALRTFLLELVEDPVRALLLLEFKLFALRHPESKARLEAYYEEILPSNEEKRFAALLGGTGRGKDALSRTVALRALLPALSALAIEAKFAPELLDFQARKKVASRLFDALLPAAK